MLSWDAAEFLQFISRMAFLGTIMGAMFGAIVGAECRAKSLLDPLSLTLGAINGAITAVFIAGLSGAVVAILAEPFCFKPVPKRGYDGPEWLFYSMFFALLLSAVLGGFLSPRIRRLDQSKRFRSVFRAFVGWGATGALLGILESPVFFPSFSGYFSQRSNVRLMEGATSGLCAGILGRLIIELANTATVRLMETRVIQAE
jgi:hypothetical protein